jgi:serine/threonine-protein kinase RsbT
MDKVSVKIASEIDIYFVQSELLKVIVPIGFDTVDQNKIKTIVSELGFNILKYAKNGMIRVVKLEERGKIGVLIQAVDRGPGIIDVEKALQDNYSSSGTLGLGLPGVKRLSDYFNVESIPNKETKVVVKFWYNQ